MEFCILPVRRPFNSGTSQRMKSAHSPVNRGRGPDRLMVLCSPHASRGRVRCGATAEHCTFWTSTGFAQSRLMTEWFALSHLFQPPEAVFGETEIPCCLLYTSDAAD